MNNMRLKNMVEYLTTMVKDGCDKDTKSGFFYVRHQRRKKQKLCLNAVTLSCVAARLGKPR